MTSVWDNYTIYCLSQGDSWVSYSTTIISSWAVVPKHTRPATSFFIFQRFMDTWCSLTGEHGVCLIWTQSEWGSRLYSLVGGTAPCSGDNYTVYCLPWGAPWTLVNIQPTSIAKCYLFQGMRYILFVQQRLPLDKNLEPATWLEWMYVHLNKMIPCLKPVVQTLVLYLIVCQAVIFCEGLMVCLWQ